jgi:predicted secreted hydrolase
MRSSVLLTLLLSIAGIAAEYRRALPGYHFEFPKDYFNHPEFRTEWWYFTGNLRDSAGHLFGYELTFFRHGIDRGKARNVWHVDDVWFAHFAMSDINGRKFVHTERFNRSGAGLAGAELGRIWNGNWHVKWRLDDSKAPSFSSISLQAVAEDFATNLQLTSDKPAVVHGENGISQKSAGLGRASHYVSLTRLQTRGSLRFGQQNYRVEGTSWMDHEFFTHSLEKNQSGWDWFSLQLDDGSELMLYRLRRKDGSVEPYSSGTFVDAKGRPRHLRLEEFELRPGRTWTSPLSNGAYPVEWQVRVPSLSLDVKLTTRLNNQELAGKSKTAAVYWEGAIEVQGSHTGRGYLEMTGYAGAVRMGD